MISILDLLIVLANNSSWRSVKVSAINTHTQCMCRYLASWVERIEPEKGGGGAGVEEVLIMISMKCFLKKRMGQDPFEKFLKTKGWYQS